MTVANWIIAFTALISVLILIYDKINNRKKIDFKIWKNEFRIPTEMTKLVHFCREICFSIEKEIVSENNSEIPYEIRNAVHSYKTIQEKFKKLEISLDDMSKLTQIENLYLVEIKNNSKKIIKNPKIVTNSMYFNGFYSSSSHGKMIQGQFDGSIEINDLKPTEQVTLGIWSAHNIYFDEKSVRLVFNDGCEFARTEIEFFKESQMWKWLFLKHFWVMLSMFWVIYLALLLLSLFLR